MDAERRVKTLHNCGQQEQYSFLNWTPFEALLLLCGDKFSSELGMLALHTDTINLY